MAIEKLREKSVDPGLIDEIKSILEKLDLARFASHTPDKTEAQAAYRKTHELLQSLEKAKITNG